METVNGKGSEKELYEPIRGHLMAAFGDESHICHLEVTADGVFSHTLKSFVRHDIIFSFLGKKASPDLTGFITKKGPDVVIGSMSSIQDFITVEIKRERITLQDIYQAKMYGDLFGAKYALLISPERIPEEIKRLDQCIFVTYRYMSGWYLYVGEWYAPEYMMEPFRWLPHSPFKDLGY